MKTLLFLDTNYIIDNFKELNNDTAQKFRNESFVLATSNHALSETINRRFRALVSLYKDIERKKEKDSANFLQITLLKPDGNTKNKIFEFIEKKSIAVFEKIIKQDIKTMIDKVYERNALKIPPFDREGDRGWMVTLIWLDFLELCKYPEYDNCYFLTKDKAFSSELIDEFKLIYPNKKCLIMSDSILQIYNNLLDKINESVEIKEDSSKKNFSKQELLFPKEDIANIRKAIKDVFYSLEEDDFGESYTVRNFRFSEKITLIIAESFCQMMEANLSSYLFHDQIDLTDIFEDSGINDFSILKTISLEVFNSFVLKWREVQATDYRSAFITLVYDCINDLVVYDYYY